MTTTSFPQSHRHRHMDCHDRLYPSHRSTTSRPNRLPVMSIRAFIASRRQGIYRTADAAAVQQSFLP